MQALLRSNRLVLMSLLCSVLCGWRSGGVRAQEKVKVEQFIPLKITPVFDPSINRLPEAEQQLIKSALVGTAIAWFQDVLKVRPLTDNITHSRNCVSTVQYLVGGERYCGGGCAPRTMCGPVDIPEEHLQPCKRCDIDGLDCETVVSQPPSSSNSFTPGTHLLLYVASLNEQPCQGWYAPPLYAGHCQLEDDFDRPVSGYMNICPGRLSTDAAYFHLQLKTVVHEMLHVLAFSEELFPYFRDENGRPRTPRTNEGRPVKSLSGQVDVNRNTVRTVRKTWAVHKQEIFHDVRLMVTPNVMREVQDHFDCPTLLGAELENQGGFGRALRHWEKRVFGEEQMTTSPSFSSVVSRVTLALLQDSGWYLPDYGYAGEPLWGRKQGCAFVNSSCSAWLNYAKEMNIDASPFCTEREWREDRLSCSERRTRVGECSMRNYPYPLRLEYRYLEGTLGGTDVYADYCPLFASAEYGAYKGGWSCEDPQNTPALNVARETYGRESRCFRQGDPWVARNSTGAIVSVQERFGAGCYRFTCSGRRLFIEVPGSTTEVRCGKRGQKKRITVEKDGVTYEGTLVCPDYDELCSSYDCLNLCSGHGTCSKGSCKCQPGYFGDDCSRSFSEQLMNCNEVTCQNGGSCQDTDTGFSCLCPPNRTGAFCEDELVLSPCINVNCSGNGVCTTTRLGRQFECQCYDGFAGKECSVVLNACDDAGIPCKHGHCVNTPTPMCECEAFYFGPQCDQRNEYCTPNPCENSGTCINRPEDTTYECLCPVTYEGDHCETEIINPCEEDSCTSNATCLRINNVRFRCVCPKGYEGDSCEKKIDYCADSPCSNGGSCVNLETSFECICTRGYKGRKCKNRRNPCIPNPCLHGRCNRDNNGPWGEIVCDCEAAYRGEFCEERIPSCSPNPCLNGGRCTDFGGGTITCACTNGYRGMHCEEVPCPLGFDGQNCLDSVPALPHFSGNGHLFLSAPHENILTVFAISISIRPQELNGLIFLRWQDTDRDGDFISIGLRDGVVEFRFDARTGPAFIQSHQVLELNRWHVVSASKHGKNGSLQVSTDPSHPSSGYSQGPFVHMNLERSLIHVGGYSNVSALPERIGGFTNGFHGCVSHLNVNGHMLDLVGNSTKDQVNQCKDGSPCSESFEACEFGGGSCRASHSDYWCECHAGYSGDSCNSTSVPTEPSFNGQSYLTMQPNVGSFLNINLSITLTPTAADGLVLLIATNSMGPGDFLAVGLKNGTVDFYFNQMDIMNNEVCIKSREKVVLGQRNTLTLLKRGTAGSVQVNQGQTAHGTPSGDHRYLHISDQATMYVGGHPTWDTVPPCLESYIVSGYQGCIHKVAFNGIELDFTQAHSSRATRDCNWRT